MEQPARGCDEQRPQPLAAADRGMPHRLEQPRARIGRHFEQDVEQPIHILADLDEGRPRG
jgi:hypothetical protein